MADRTQLGSVAAPLGRSTTEPQHLRHTAHVGAVSDRPPAPVEWNSAAASVTLQLLGQSWVLLILREVFDGVHTFTAILRQLGIDRRVLAARLRLLVDHGILEKYEYQSSPKRGAYRLTDHGRRLHPALSSLISWGNDGFHAAQMENTGGGVGNGHDHPRSPGRYGYPPEFQRRAVELARTSTASIDELALELGISHQSLRNWLRQAEIDAGRRAGLSTTDRRTISEIRPNGARRREPNR